VLLLAFAGAKELAMSRKRLSRNAPCPCGSGKKYKQCCFRKAFDWVEDDEGNIFKSMPLSDEMKDVLDEQRELFIEQHGREPGPDDPVFPNMPHPEHMEHELIEIMKEAGVNPAIIHATERTGRLVTEENQHLLSDRELDEWNAAIEEYEAEHGSTEPPEYPIGTVALYGPDDKTTTKIVAGVILEDDAEAIIERWVGTDVTTNPKAQEGIKAFFTKHGVKSVVATDQTWDVPTRKVRISRWGKIVLSVRIGKVSKEAMLCFDRLLSDQSGRSAYEALMWERG